MADELDIDPFDAAIEGLKQRLMELGASPQQATQAAAEIVQTPAPPMRQAPGGPLEVDIGAPRRMPAPTRMQPPDRSGVTAGEYGLPPMPDFGRNALAGEISASPEPSAADKISRLILGEGKATPERRRLAEGITGSSGLGRSGLGLMDVGLNQAYGATRNALEGNYGAAAMDAAQFVAPAAGKVGVKAADAFAQLPAVVKGGIVTAPLLVSSTEAGGPDAVPSGQSLAPNADELRQLVDQRKTLLDQTEAARRLREDARKRKAQEGPPDGSEPRPQDIKRYPKYSRAKEEFSSAETEFGKLNDQLAALDKQIEMARRRGDPAYLRQLQIDEEKRQADLKSQRAATPTRELYSDYMPYIPAVTGATALVGGVALKGQGVRALNRELSDISGRWKTAVDGARVADPSSPAYAMAVKEAQGLKTEFTNRLAAGDKGTVPALEFGAGAGLVGGFLPEEVDFARAVSGSPLWADLKRNVLDEWPTTLKRAAIAGGLGAGISHLGALGAKAAMGRPTPTNYGAATDAFPEPLAPSARGSSLPPEPPASPPTLGFGVPTREALASRPTRQQSQPGPTSDLPPSDILKSIKPAPREVPASFPQREPSGKPQTTAVEVLPNGMVRRDDGVLYWKAGTGKGGHPVENAILTAMGLENKPSIARAANGKKPTDIPEKTSVQIDDRAPYGRNRLADD